LILAAGDCTSFEFRGQRIRLESVQNANDQGAAAARTVAGQAGPYVPLPWFWSDQYDVKLQIAGLNLGYDDVVVRPGKNAHSQSVWYYIGERLVAVDAMNDAAAFVTAKKLLERGASVAKSAVLDRTAEFKSWLA
jgi:3-phenylpropionate/trans-cinnamate dioxygenase ferredoxin reductase subunit